MPRYFIVNNDTPITVPDDQAQSVIDRSNAEGVNLRPAEKTYIGDQPYILPSVGPGENNSTVVHFLAQKKALGLPIETVDEHIAKMAAKRSAPQNESLAGSIGDALVAGGEAVAGGFLPAGERIGKQPDAVDAAGSVRAQLGADVVSAVEGVKQTAESLTPQALFHAGIKNTRRAIDSIRGVDTPPQDPAMPEDTVLNASGDKIDQLLHSVENEGQGAFQDDMATVMKDGGIPSVVSYAIASAAWRQSLTLLMMQGSVGALPGMAVDSASTVKDVADIAKMNATYTKETLTSAAKFGAFQYAATDGTPEEKAKSAAGAVAFSAMPAITVGASTDAMAKLGSMALNLGYSELTDGAFTGLFDTSTWSDPQKRAEFVQRATPALAMGVLFGAGARSGRSVTREAVAKIFGEDQADEVIRQYAKQQAHTADPAAAQAASQVEDVLPSDGMQSPNPEARAVAAVKPSQPFTIDTFGAASAAMATPPDTGIKMFDPPELASKLTAAARQPSTDDALAILNAEAQRKETQNAQTTATPEDAATHPGPTARGVSGTGAESVRQPNDAQAKDEAPASGDGPGQGLLKPISDPSPVGQSPSEQNPPKTASTVPATAAPTVTGEAVSEPAPATTAKVKAAVKVETAPSGDKTVSVPSKDKRGIPLPEQKRYLIAELDKAIEDAPIGQAFDTKTMATELEPLAKKAGLSLQDYYARESNKPSVSGGKVTIEVPGDGTFTLAHDKANLINFKKRVSAQFPSKVPAPDKPSQRSAAGTIDEAADKAIDLYGNADAAAKKMRAQVERMPPTEDSKADQSNIDRWMRVISELESRAETTSVPADQKSTRITTVRAQVAAEQYKLEESKAMQEREKRRKVATAALKAHPRFAELESALKDKGASMATGDLLNVHVEGRGAPAVRTMQDEIAKDLGLYRSKPVKTFRGTVPGTFDLSRYWKDSAESFTPTPEPDPVAAQAQKTAATPESKPPAIGEPSRLMGVDVTLADSKTVDGVRYEIHSAAKGADKRAVVRVTDVDSGKVSTLKTYPTFDAAAKEYADALKAVGEKPSGVVEKPAPVVSPEPTVGTRVKLKGSPQTATITEVSHDDATGDTYYTLKAEAGGRVIQNATTADFAPVKPSMEGATPAPKRDLDAELKAAGMDPTAFKSAKEKAAALKRNEAIRRGPGAMTGAAESDAPESYTGTALKHAVDEMERQQLGIKALPPQEQQNMAQAWLRAGDRLATDPEAGRRLIADLVNNPTRALTGDDSAIVLRWKQVLQNRMNEAASRTHDADPTVSDHAYSDLYAHRDELNQLMDAVHRRGSEWGREGRWRQAFTNDVFDFESQRRLLSAAVGRELSATESESLRKQVEDYQKKIADLEAHLAKLSQAQGEAAIDDTLATAKKARASRTPGAKPEVGSIDEITAKLEKHFGAGKKPEQAYGIVQQLVRRIVEDNPAIDRKGLVDAVHGILSRHGIERSDTADLISGRGRFWRPSQDEVSVTVRDLRTQIRLTSHQEDVLAGNPLPRTGSQRDPMSDEARHQLDILEELKRRVGVVVTGPESQLASEAQKRLTYYQNRIRDLQHEMDTQTPIVNVKSETTDTPEITAAKERYKALKEQRDALFDTALAEHKARLTREADGLEKRLADGEFEKVKKPKVELKLDDEARQLQARVDAAKDALDAGRRKANADRLKIEFERRIASGSLVGSRPIFSPAESMAIWQHAREAYIDKGVDNLKEVAAKTAKDLGLKPEWVTRAITEKQAANRQTDDAWMQQYVRNRIKSEAKFATDQADAPWWRKALNVVIDIPRGLAVFGHGTVGMVTHAGEGIFRPTGWATYWPNFFKQFHIMFGKAAVYDAAERSLTQHPDYVMKLRAGLDIDPSRIYDDYQTYSKAMRFLGRVPAEIAARGNKAWIALKLYRSESFDREWAKIPESERTPDRAKVLATWINHHSGAANTGRIPEGVKGLMFAPSLEMSRWARVVGEPARVVNAYTSRTATPAEKAQARFILKRDAELVGTYLGMLAANAGILAATGQKDKVNLLDPSKADWMKFKWDGKTLDFTGGVLAPIRLLSRVLQIANPWYTNTRGDPKLRLMGQELTQYGRGKLTPGIGMITDFATQEDAMGRPLPFSQKKGTEYHPKISWGEFAWQRAPIPASGAAREVYDVLREKDVDDKTAKAIVLGLVTFGVENLGVRIGNSSPDAKPKGPRSIKTQEDLHAWVNEK